MNSNIAILSPFGAAIAAFLILPVSPLAAGYLVTVTGVLLILKLDYGRPRYPDDLTAKIILFRSMNSPPARFGEAA